MRILSFYLLSGFFFLSAQASGALFCSHILKAPTAREAVRMFEFPEEAEFRTVEAVLKDAIYEAFGGRDYYTGEKISIREMTIDHIIPKSKGGPNNIFNYVPTVVSENQDKGASFVWSRERRSLSDVRDIYGPRVMEILEAQGILALRARQREEIIIKGQKLKKPGYHILFHGLTLEVREFIDHVFKEFSKRSDAEKREIQRTNSMTVPLLRFDERDIEHALSEFRYNMEHVDREFRERHEAEGEVMSLHSEDFSFAARSDVDVRLHPELIKKLIESGAVGLTANEVFNSSSISREDFVNWTDFY